MSGQKVQIEKRFTFFIALLGSGLSGTLPPSLLFHYLTFLTDESGMGVVEILLITVVLIAMVLIFQNKITTLVNNIWKSIGKSAKKIY